MKCSQFLSILVLAFFIVFCNSGKTWEQVKEENTIASYQEFLNTHSETEHKDSILTLIMELEWIEIKQDTSVSALDSFKLKYPDNIVYKDSIERLEMAIEWKTALNKNTIEGFEKFLKNYSSSSYKYSAKGKIEEVKWLEVKKINKKKDYIKFLADFALSNYSDSIDFQFELKDFKGYNVEFEGKDKDATGDINEKIALNFHYDGKLTGSAEGDQEGQNYFNSWSYEIRGAYDDQTFMNLESRFLGMSDEVDSEPDEVWSELKIEFNHEETIIMKDERRYKLVEISRIEEN